jgi:hypothetical protein
MTKRYTGGVVSSSLPTVNAAGASGVFLLSQQADYQAKNNWPPYKIEESLRFRASASGNLSRTPSVSGNRKTWTFSAWFKWSVSDNGAFNQGIFGSDSSGLSGIVIAQSPNTPYQMSLYNCGSQITTTQVFRDPSSWYHVVGAIDTTQATAANRTKLYINGVQVTSFSTASYPAQNTDSDINAAGIASFLGNQPGQTRYFDGYMAEINLIDGLALTPSAFGATDKDGNWSPIAYTGTYGQNGFYLNFSNNASAATMGSDSSGNGNNWTLNNFNVSTANTTYDIMIDVPEDQAGANNRGNFCTLNPLHYALGGTNYYTISNANQRVTGTSADNSGGTIGTISNKTGKFYFEVNMTGVDASGYVAVGASDVDQYSALTNYNFLGYGSKSYSYYSSGVKTSNNSNSSYGNSFATGDVIGVAIDCDNGAIYFSKNNTWQASGDPTSGATKTGAAFTWTGASQSMIPQFEVYRTGSIADTNFGQRPFTYAPPTGFKSLNTFNLPEPTIKQPNKHFDISLWAGNGTAQTIANAGSFAPDFTWIKSRGGGNSHFLNNRIIGPIRTVITNSTGAEGTETNGLTAFTSTGFTVGSDASVNTNGGSYVGWQWNAGGANTTNTSGSVTSIVRANPTAGFSVVTYTGNSTGATVGHGLGATPTMIIIKNRTASSNWRVWHQSLASTTQSYLSLNLTNAALTDATIWNNTAPTSSVFSVGNDSSVNTSPNTYVAYCFAQIAGYSSFGSYTGNGSSDGPFVYTGFRPRYVMVKRTDSTADWIVFDTARSPYNFVQNILYPNLSDAENVAGSAFYDILSNGFKARLAGGSAVNTSGATYIYMAFAEMPFKYARSR